MDLSAHINGSQNNHLSFRRIAIFFCVVFAFTLFEGWLIRQYLLPYVFVNLHDGLGFMVGGDAKVYHDVAVQLAEKINALGWSAWELRPNTENASLATPSGIASAVYVLFGSNPLFLLPFNSVVQAATATLLFKTMHSLFADSKCLVAIIATLPFILFPTAVSWTSQLLRDGIFILGAFLYLWGWILIARVRYFSLKTLFISLCFALPGIWIVWAVRSYMCEVYIAITVIIGLCACVMIAASSNRKVVGLGLIRRALGVVIFGFILISVLALLSSIEKYTYLKKAQEMSEIFINKDSNISTTLESPAETQDFIDHERPASRCKERWVEFEYAPSLLNRILKSIIMAREGYYGYIYRNSGSTIDQKVCINSASDLMLYLPRALQIGLLAPFPNQWFDPNSHGQGASRKIAGAEMVVTYIALLGLICLGAGLRKKIELSIVLSYVLPMLLLLSVVTPNIGALHRQRYGFLMVLVGIGLGLIAKYLLSRKAMHVAKANYDE